MTGDQASGGCLCGAVRYRVEGPLRPVVSCHCTQCQRWSGHFVAATAAGRANLHIDGEAELSWYESSPGIRRGFCRRCGSSLFWEKVAAPSVSIMAGTLEPPTGLDSVSHIYMADKSDYYRIADGLPQHPRHDDATRPA